MLIVLTGCKSERQDTHKTDFYEQIKSTDRLLLASMTVTKTARFEDSKWYKPGKRIALYSYDTYLQASIDLQELLPEDIEVDEARSRVVVTLPPIEAEMIGRDMTMRKEYENIGILRSEIDSRERAALKEAANRSLREEIRDNPEILGTLREEARRKARLYFETLFASRGYTAEIRFRNDSIHPSLNSDIREIRLR